MKLEGRIAVVTGGASGIGKAIAHAFAKEGAKIVIADLDEESAEKTVDEVKSFGSEAIAVKADVGFSKDVANVVNKTIEVYGGINILVNNAGIILQAPVVDTREEDWDKILRNNLKSCFLCCREVARRMIEQKKGGKIINISSIHAILSEPSAGAYTAAKGGMEAFSRTLATELAPHKINVNCIEPGATYTELTLPMYTDAVKKSLYERIPLREIAQPEWIAGGAVFLASDDSRYMTGQALAIDGGYTMDGSLPGASYWEE
ncbi:MAG: 3-oxoacyl-ACP reductase FabG [Spirochaetales bacterium]|jgi:NAD(P)-dependent dehydrogenase (short-subunit alcohol dehydrogenase family)|nr:3-oxoacyl-ACP reductase FabG [Spirochaetales bacterium]